MGTKTTVTQYALSLAAPGAVLAGLMSLAPPRAAAQPNGIRYWNCVLPDGGVVRISGTEQDRHAFEQATGAQCYRWRPDGGNGYSPDGSSPAPAPQPATAPATAPPPPGGFAGTWTGNWAVGDVASGVMAMEVAPSGTLTGTVHNLTFGITASIKGHVGADGHFTNLAISDGLPGGVSITCGVLEIAANGHLVTSQWGVQESGCDNSGWWQDLTRQRP